MTVWILAAAASFAVAFLLFARLLIHHGRSACTALAALPLSLALGLVLAKGMYEVLMRADYFLVWGELHVFLDLQPRRMCFTAGAFGVCLGVRLVAGRRKGDPAAVMDCFAAPGALLVAGFRMAESALGMLGAGPFLEHGGVWPLAVTDAYGDCYLAVYTLEAAVALGSCLAALRYREEKPGLRFQKTVFALCLCQLLLENLRNQSMMWGFVHTEQALCAVILFLLMVMAVRKAAERKDRILPLVLYLLLTAAIVGEEFLRQKGGSLFFSRYGYVLLGLILAAMAWNYAAALRRMRQSSSITGRSGQESSKGM